MENSSNGTAGSGKTALIYRQHWHVLLTHFPVSFFLGAFGFIILHLLTRESCFELAAYVALIAGTVIVIPTTITGWITWKGRYKGLMGKLFQNKIRISFCLIAVSIFLVIYRSFFDIRLLDILHNIHHAIYFTGIILLVIGSGAEGLFGGRLNHK
jgi:uncharacterized membrane protein